MEFAGKKVLVFGTGISGIAAAKLLENVGAAVVLFDGNQELDKKHVLENFEADHMPELYVGELPEEVRAGLDLVVLSPGVPTDLPFVNELRDAGLPIWGEIELAYRCKKGDVLAITGTNGKTTTTALLGEIMKTTYPQVHVVGNIGIPYTGLVAEDTDDTVTVAEISSFQLETIDTFCPEVSAILNITPDHLNRHHTMDNYIAAKMSIAKNQGPEQTCVLNYEDEVLREQAKHLSAKVVFFSSLSKLEEGFYLEGDKIVYAHDGQIEEIISTDELNILGRHNHENAMAATAMAMSYDVPDAAIKGIQAMDRPTCLIGGGYDKQSEYTEWINSFDGKVKKLVLIGQTREKIAEEAEKCGFYDYVFADSLQEAVDICYENAENGDAVLLSPACASWGMFPNYEVRGKMFKEMVHALKE